MLTIVLLSLGVVSLVVPGVATGTAVAMALAAIVGLRASRLHAFADALAAGGEPTVETVVRRARFCDDAAFALSLLALLYALPF